MPYYVYLLASRRHGTLYLGYGVDRLVWYEVYGDVTEAIRREKQIKKWRRDWKIALIEADNPDWSDLYDRIAV